MAKRKFERLFPPAQVENRFVDIIANKYAYIITCQGKLIKSLHTWQQLGFNYQKNRPLFYLQKGSAIRETKKFNKLFKTDQFDVVELWLNSAGQVISQKLENIDAK